MLATPARDVAPPRDACEQLSNLVGLRRATRGRRLRARCRCRRARRRAGARCGVPEPPRVRARPRSHGRFAIPVAGSRRSRASTSAKRRAFARPVATSARSSFNADTCSGRNACGAVAYATSVPGTPAFEPSGATSAEWKRSSSGSPAARVGPVDRGSAKRSCRRLAESLLDELVLGARSVRRDDGPPTRPLGAKDDGIGSRSGRRLGHELVDELVEVERQRLGAPVSGIHHARDGLLDAGRDRLQMTADAIERAFELLLRFPPRSAHGEDRERADSQHSERRDNRSHHHSSQHVLASRTVFSASPLGYGRASSCSATISRLAGRHMRARRRIEIVYVRLEPDLYTVSQAIDLQ